MPDPLHLSALSQYAYCPRRFALIHVEGQWADNRFTAAGSLSHERVHGGGFEVREGVKTLRALPLFSRRYGIAGVADVVELSENGEPLPVEYKSSRVPRTHKAGRRAEDTQLCAQALCLEEMFKVSIPSGFIYHIASHKRREVTFTPQLREAVQGVIDGANQLLSSQALPPPAADERCEFCSLFETCEPFAPREWPRGYDPFATGDV